MDSIPHRTEAPIPDLLAELLAISSATERARRVSLIARERGNLPAPLAALRTTALHELRAQKLLVRDIAAAVGLSAGRVSQLTRQVTA